MLADSNSKQDLVTGKRDKKLQKRGVFSTKPPCSRAYGHAPTILIHGAFDSSNRPEVICTNGVGLN